MICNMDSIGKYMLEIILHQQRTLQLLKQRKLVQTQEDHSNPIPALNVDLLKVDLVVIQNTCSEKEYSNSETASSKPVKESSLDFATKDVQDVKSKRKMHGKFSISSFTPSNTFTSTMLLNVDQLQKQLDKAEFQEDGSMAAFWLVNNQFQKFIDSQFTLDYDSQMTDKYFVEYTGIEVKQFRHTLLQLMGNVKKSVAERTRHQRQYDRRLNKRQMQTQKSKIDTGKAVYADLVVTESSGTESKVQDDSSRSGNDTNADDADIRPIYDEEPMAEIFTRHRFSPNKTSVVYEKTSPRSDLRWKPTGRIFKSVSLKWIPAGKLFDSCTSKDDSEPTHGSNVDIPNIHESKQTLDLSASTSIQCFRKEQSHRLSAGTLCNVNKENLRVWLLKKLISQKPLSKWIHR
ncbi:hypothetical protein Tco_1214303 [Tanacetum coccineum]